MNRWIDSSDADEYFERLAEEQAGYGDPRRCPRHPHIAISSPDGLFDAPCSLCEQEMYEASYEDRPLLADTVTIDEPETPPIEVDDDDIPF